MNGWWFPLMLSGIPVTWWVTNKTRFAIARWWSKRSKPYVPQGSLPPSTPVYCAEHDGLTTVSEMRWSDDGEYICAACLGEYDQEEAQEATSERYAKWDPGPSIVSGWMGSEDYANNRGDDPWDAGGVYIAGQWPGIGGNPNAIRRFNEQGLECDPAGTPLHVLQRYRANGIAVTVKGNAAYEERIARRQVARLARQAARHGQAIRPWDAGVR